MSLYEFRQNNSGGSFDEPAIIVYIEADSASEANTIAESIGLYFDGVDDGLDCECCGDRWYRAWEGDGVDSIDEPNGFITSYAKSDGVPAIRVYRKG